MDWLRLASHMDMNKRTDLVERLASNGFFVRWFPLFLVVQGPSLILGFGARALGAKDLRAALYPYMYDLYLATALLTLLVVATYIGVQRKNEIGYLPKFCAHWPVLPDIKKLAGFFLFSCMLTIEGGSVVRDASFPDGVFSRFADHPSIPAQWLFPIVALALFEEIVFRGYLMSWLQRRFGRVAALAISSLVFAAYHLDASLSPFLYHLLMGVAWGLVVLATNSLAQAAGIHAGYNFAVIMADGPDGLLRF